MAGHSGRSPLDRARPLVAFFLRSVMGNQRRDFLRAAVLDRPVAEAVPTAWAVFPNALSTALQYLSLQFPLDHSWTSYNGLQQLAYFLTVFIAAPLAIITGLMQSPAIANKLGWFAKIFNRQAARTIHFVVLCWFLFFIFIHVTLVFITGMRQNLNYMFAGVNDNSWEGVLVFSAAMAVVVAAWYLASPFTIKHARLVQKAGQAMVGPIKGVAEWGDPNTQYTEKDISPYFWLNGTLPHSDEFNALVKGGFASYSLRVDGLVANPGSSRTRSSREYRSKSRSPNTSIQGWSGVAKWGGVPMRRILDIVKPTPEARYAVFYSFSEGSEGGVYYDVHRIQNMRHELTILAYEMNGHRSVCFMEHHYDCDARTNWVSRWSNGSRLSSSCMILLIWEPATVAITKIMNSMAIVCRFECSIKSIVPATENPTQSLPPREPPDGEEGVGGSVE